MDPEMGGASGNEIPIRADGIRSGCRVLGLLPFTSNLRQIAAVDSTQSLIKHD